MVKKLRRADPVAEILGTNNKKEQAAHIQELLQMVNAPVVDLVVRFDARTQQVSVEVVGPDVLGSVAQQILEAAKNMLHQKELAAAVELSAPETGGENVPEGPVTPDPTEKPEPGDEGVPTPDTEELPNAE